MGLVMLAGIFLFIVYLFWRRRRITRELVAFYEQNQIAREPHPPKAVEALLGNARWICYKCELKQADGSSFPIHWWTGSRFQPGAGSQPGSLYCFLAVSAPAGKLLVAYEKARKAMKRPRSFREKLYYFVALDTETPIRAELPVEDTILIVWPTLERADVQGRRMQWLRDCL